MAVLALDVGACACVPNVRPCVRFPWADAVFVGTVIETQGDERLGNQARVQVEEVFVGLDASELSEVVVNGYGGGLSCGMTFKKDTRLLFYAERDEAGNLTARACSGTAPVDRASEDLAYLRGMVADPPVGSIFGHARVSRSGEPLKEVRIRVRGQGVEQETTTDSVGRYEVADLAPGTYTMDVSSVDARLRLSRSVKVTVHGCTWINFVAKGKRLESFPPEMLPDEADLNPPLAPCQASSVSDAAFLGTVMGIEEAQGKVGGNLILPGIRARVQVDEVFHGLSVADRREVLVRSTAPCLQNLRPGDRHIFYVDHLGGGVFYAAVCTRMRPEAEAQSDLEYLRALPTLPPGARIFGRVAQWSRSKGMK